MDREGFLAWLVCERGMKENAAKSRVSNVARIEKEYDLDACFKNDNCMELLSDFEYTKEDSKQGSIPNVNIVINGDYYTGIQTLKMALNLYVDYLESSQQNNLKHTNHCASNGKAPLCTGDKVCKTFINKKLSAAEGPRYLGNLAGFKTYIAASYRNKVNIWARPARDGRNGECEYCHNKAELQSAHKHGMEFKDIIKKILEENFKQSKDYYDVDLNKFEELFKVAHTPIENTFYFLCENCHNAYDKSNTITDSMIEAERKK